MDGLGFLIDFVEKRDEVGSCFTSAIFGSSDDTFACDDKRYGLLLNGRRHHISTLGERQEDILLEFEFCKVFVFGSFDVLHLKEGTLVC